MFTLSIGDQINTNLRLAGRRGLHLEQRKQQIAFISCLLQLHSTESVRLRFIFWDDVIENTDIRDAVLVLPCMIESYDMNVNSISIRGYGL